MPLISPHLTQRRIVLSGKLFDKIYGCLAGSRIGSAMGAPTEGWSMEKITETHGVRVAGQQLQQPVAPGQGPAQEAEDLAVVGQRVHQVDGVVHAQAALDLELVALLHGVVVTGARHTRRVILEVRKATSSIMPSEPSRHSFAP